jgi:hypothetical protein
VHERDRVHEPGGDLRSAQIDAAPAGNRSAVFDDSCAISRSLRAVGNAIANVAGFCGGFIRCPKAFTIYDRETRQTTARGPDICRWSISLWVAGPPAAVISSPC